MSTAPKSWFTRWRHLLCLLPLLLAGLSAQAQNATNGKTLYNTRFGTQNQGCYSCHGIQGNTLVNNQKIRNGVNAPTVIQRAITNNTGGMGFLGPFLNSSQIADIAAYLGNPSLAGASSPAASVSPATLSFTSTNVGATSAAQTVTLSNTGTAALSLSTIAVSNASFAVSGGTCAAGGSVAAGGSCTATVVFRPSAAGSVSATLTFTHNASPTTSTVTLSGTGVALAPVASVSPASLSFTQLINTTSTAQTVSITNTGTAPLVISGTSFSGTNAAEFAVASGGSCANGASVAINASCTYAVSFTPTVAAARSANLVISHNAGSSTVTLSGTGTAAPQAVIALNRNSLSFASQVVGTPATAQTITVSNTGQAAMTLSALTLGGGNPADFSLGGSCSVGASIAAGANCTLSVGFTPGAIGARAATLTIASNAANGNASATLSGTGTAAPAPVVGLSPTTVAFGNVTIGGAAVTRAVTLTNSGNAALSIASIAATGTGFGSSSNCGSSLAAGASCTVTASFLPTTTGSASGQIAVASNAAGSPHAVALSGAGQATPVGTLSWSGAGSLSFTDTALGAGSAAQTLTLANAGPGSATLSALSVQGATAGEFALGGSCATGTTLASGASCTVSVSFHPAQLGLRSAQLSITSNGSDPTPAALSGNGIAPAQAALSMSPSSISFVSTMGSNAAPPVPVLLTNTGTATVTITALSFSSPDFSVRDAAQNGCGALPISLPPGQQCQLEVVLNPTSTGSLNGTLTLSSNVTDPAANRLAVSAAVSAAPTSASNLGEGGCSIAPPGGGATDPTLPLLVALALLVAWRRHRAARAAASSRQPHENA